MKTKTSIILLMALSLLIISSCDKSILPVRGNGEVITESRSVSGFDRVANEGQFEVYIIQDDERYLKVEAESNLIGRIRTRMSGNTLEIDSRDNLKPSRPMKLYLHTPDVRGVALSGSGLIDLGTINTDELAVSLSGSGDISGDVETVSMGLNISGSGNARLSLRCNSLETFISGSGEMYFSGEGNIARHNISGSGQIHANNFPVNQCFAKISGSGDMFLNVTEELDAQISGSGSIYYIGTPMINTNITGSGSVINKN